MEKLLVVYIVNSNGPDLSQWSVPVEKRWASLFEAFVKENIGLDTCKFTSFLESNFLF